MTDNNKATEVVKDPPAGGNAGQGNGTSTAPLDNLPEKFKGKSVEEIVKSYSELEEKLGKDSQTVEEAKKTREQYELMTTAIWADPELYKNVEKGMRKLQGLPVDEEKPKKDAENGKDKPSPEVLDLRKSEENRIMSEFYTTHGYSNLEGEERKTRLKNLGVVLADILDPSGTKSVQEIVSTIPLSKLPKFLKYAHSVANVDLIKKQVHDKALADSEQNDDAAFGSFPSSGGSGGQSVTITKQERDVAQKLGVKPEAYVKRKSEIAEAEKRFGR